MSTLPTVHTCNFDFRRPVNLVSKYSYHIYILFILLLQISGLFFYYLSNVLSAKIIIKVYGIFSFRIVRLVNRFIVTRRRAYYTVSFCPLRESEKMFVSNLASYLYRNICTYIYIYIYIYIYKYILFFYFKNLAKIKRK
ncbi:hypothetical protein PUN28_002828 [Cardiocondyla obscurior]|uniref:Uncharacterized protein n=1 Tax=Cardiocondyla obscurior TaxID=286306 RepID=A0AAW2GWJ7_9HYME